jgi:ribosomal protein S18 acetylase RimI-like enzyme
MIIYRIAPSVSNDELNNLFLAAWPDHQWRDFKPLLNQSLTFVCAYQAHQLVGFVNLVWDGGLHAFILDTTVHPELRRNGIGLKLVQQAAEFAQDNGVKWLHVDYEPHLRGFYQKCGFRHTEAGLRGL